MEDKNICLTYKIDEITNEVSCRENVESDDLALMIGDADRESKSSNVSSCEQTRSNALSTTSPTVYNTEKRIRPENQNNLGEGTTSVGLKGSAKVASDIKTDPDNPYDGTNVQEDGLVDGIEPKESGTVSNSKTIHQYDKTPFIAV